MRLNFAKSDQSSKEYTYNWFNLCVPDEEVYAKILLESRCLKSMKSTAADTAIVNPEINDTT